VASGGPGNAPRPAQRARADAPEKGAGGPVLRLRAANDNDVSLGRLVRLLCRAGARPVMLLAAVAALVAALIYLV